MRRFKREADTLLPTDAIMVSRMLLMRYLPRYGVGNRLCAACGQATTVLVASLRNILVRALMISPPP